MYNKVIMIGRLVADPELRTTPNGINVASLRIAVDRPYSKGGERKSDFFNAVAWRQNAEFISRYFSKGRLIGIEGSLQTRDYTDKEGNKRTAFEIQIDRAFFTASKASAGGGMPGDSPAPVSAPAAGVSYASGSNGDFQAIDDDDDLPF